jgi:outer membrane protein
MKHIIFFILLLSTFATTVKVSAETNIAILDLDIVINNSIAGKNMIKTLENLHKKKIDNYKKIEEEIKNEETKIVAKKNILSKEEYQKEINILRQKVKNYRTDRKNSTDILTKKRLEASSKLLKLINPILLEYSTANSIDIILRKKTIIIGKSDKDITKQILELVNQKIKKIEIK